MGKQVTRVQQDQGSGRPRSRMTWELGLVEHQAALGSRAPCLSDQFLKK